MKWTWTKLLCSLLILLLVLRSLLSVRTQPFLLPFKVNWHKTVPTDNTRYFFSRGKLVDITSYETRIYIIHIIIIAVVSTFTPTFGTYCAIKRCNCKKIIGSLQGNLSFHIVFLQEIHQFTFLSHPFSYFFLTKPYMKGKCYEIWDQKESTKIQDEAYSTTCSGIIFLNRKMYIVWS